MLEDGEEDVKDLNLRIVLLKKVSERRERSEKAHLPFAISTSKRVLAKESNNQTILCFLISIRYRKEKNKINTEE